jgi:hypothetical protein
LPARAVDHLSGQEIRIGRDQKRHQVPRFVLRGQSSGRGPEGERDIRAILKDDRALEPYPADMAAAQLADRVGVGRSSRTQARVFVSLFMTAIGRYERATLRSECLITSS